MTRSPISERTPRPRILRSPRSEAVPAALAVIAGAPPRVGACSRRSGDDRRRQLRRQRLDRLRLLRPVRLGRAGVRLARAAARSRRREAGPAVRPRAGSDLRPAAARRLVVALDPLGRVLVCGLGGCGSLALLPGGGGDPAPTASGSATRAPVARRGGRPPSRVG